MGPTEKDVLVDWLNWLAHLPPKFKMVLATVGAVIVVSLLLLFELFRLKLKADGNKRKAVVPNGSNGLTKEWTKGALEKISAHSCPIFDGIERAQNPMPWGSVLDAGTGSHSLEWILSIETNRWVAITGDRKRQTELEREYASKFREQDVLTTGNWRDPEFLKGQRKVFDVVLADYLLGSVDAYAPFFQDRLFDRLHPHVGRRLYITGAEPLPDHTQDPHGKIIVEIHKTRDACILLAGERPYREYPLDWVLRHVKHKFRVTHVSFFETSHTRGFVETQISVAESKLHKIKDQSLRKTMKGHLNELRWRVRKMTWPAEFSHDYVVCLEPVESLEEEAEEPKVPEGYRSEVQEQRQVYPRDEHSSDSETSDEEKKDK
ncbi:hypothetical protein PROFUN_03656 [Planoprotostelium fungivorum]|uniref:Methyltransferase domain-containing protein n=1 Tax=Planoprotostelium fungivorum TaxID=1890364 RepID=A0A2P6NSQ1_9EUKA|nr:hypothetical protein PROFUN_03656 [Planoprotostelium fungivorum]